MGAMIASRKFCQTDKDQRKKTRGLPRQKSVLK